MLSYQNTCKENIIWRHLYAVWANSHLLVHDDDHECDDGEPVDEAVPGDGVPVQRDPLAGEQTADGDHAEDVEYGAADDRPDAEVVLRNERAHHVGEELGRARAYSKICMSYKRLSMFYDLTLTCRHERCPSHVRLEVERIANDLQHRDEVVVTDHAQSHDEVERDDDVRRDSALLPLLRCDEVWRKLLDGWVSAVFGG